MSQAYKIVAGLDEFRAAREHYARIVEHLQGPETGRLEHGEVEAYLWQLFPDFLRCYVTRL